MIVWTVRGKIMRSVLCNIVLNNCAQCNSAMQTHMNRPNSSLDWVLSHRTHFTVLRFMRFTSLLDQIAVRQHVHCSQFPMSHRTSPDDPYTLSRQLCATLCLVMYSLVRRKQLSSQD